ncbi:hypothetical protein [Actinoallomurus sp. NPDC050550]|uniref:hypothetical protein n=1 Tax=Actinoallomurus sp. NPDC050550 TaxID=3154937 RepID=UPI0033E0DCA9
MIARSRALRSPKIGTRATIVRSPPAITIDTSVVRPFSYLSLGHTPTFTRLGEPMAPYFGRQFLSERGDPLESGGSLATIAAFRY